MYHKRREAAQNVLDHLLAAEAAIDDAVAKTAALAAAMPMARVKANVAQEIGHDALSEVMNSCQALVDARARMVDTHRRLADARDALHLPAKAFGPLPLKDARADAGREDKPVLAVVERRAA